ncbi:sialidase [Dokdonia sp. Hel_I_53]|uniref:sialidase n=1 Tax=Dokdonia sp. Hel_I_53 TaxID=1566287 RepID=UPI00119A1775|nr:sialidase [Dokdonia sp. Hel_I_53]TVZ51941.1 hypothetical protein OD90_1103 [Dokdonia sp. Hel_I_53]
MTHQKESKFFLRSIALPQQGVSHLPRLYSTKDKLHMSWVEEEDSLSILKYAWFENDTWSIPKTVTSGTNWFINWADFPSLSVNGDKVLANILEKSAEGTYDYDIKLSVFDTLSRKRSRNSNILLNTDGIAAEHGFVSSKPYNDGFSVSWLDGRNTKNKDRYKNQMTLRNAFVTAEGVITKETELDARVCDCCSTATAITENGPIVVYRDRTSTEEEIRDISIVRYVDGVWTKPTPIAHDDWKLNGCPVNGPAMDTQGMNVVVSWFTAQGETPRVMVAFSTDAGESFQNPIRLDSGNAIGRVGAQFLKDGNALVSWLEPQDDKTALKITKVNTNRIFSNPITVSNISAERQSGFPQLAVVDNQVYIAFTMLQNDSSKVEMVSFSLVDSTLH